MPRRPPTTRGKSLFSDAAPETKPAAAAAHRANIDGASRGNPGPAPCRGASPRVFAAACSTFSKTLACPTARSSKFPFFRCKNANRPSVDGKPKSLLQQIGAIQRVALGGNEAGVGNDAAQLAFVGAVFHAGGEHHVLFDQDAPDVIGPELQAHLANLDSRGEPARLDVIDVVEIESADGQRFQIIDRRRLLHFFAERGILGGKHPGDKRGKPAGVFLDAPDARGVIDAVAWIV